MTLAKHWSALDPEVVFLNHGSFGACPGAVLEAQRELRDLMEREPVRFMVKKLEPLLDAARVELARFLGADPEGLAFVANTTAGVNTVLRSLRFEPGDEILRASHGYNACRTAAEYVAERSGARVVVAPVPFPIEGPEQVVEAILGRATGRTRLALIDHVTSPTGVVFPIERIVRELEHRGVDVLVDGAHAPGMVPLDLAAIGAAYYTGNCHKWLCAPKGAAFLQVRADRRDAIRPLAISHGTDAVHPGGRGRFRREFDWTGTGDATPFLAVPAALRFVGGLVPGGFSAVMERNRALALEGRSILCRSLAVAPPCPDSMIGSLATIALPDGSPVPISHYDLEPIQEELFQRYRIEVPVFSWPKAPRRWVRISAQLYNERAHYERLAGALRELLP